MTAKYRELAGFEPDDASDIGIRMKVLAEQVAEAYKAYAELGAQVFPQTSTGEYLELHARTRGLSRKPPVSAAGVLRLKREVPAVHSITIPRGVVCATCTDPQIRFETIEEVVLPAGETEIDAPARAVTPGRQGNCAAGSIRVMATAAPGMSSVENPEPFTGGVDGESDKALRARLLESYGHISNGTNRAFYYDLAMSNEKVVSANVLPRRRGRGTVDVVVDCAGDAADVVAELAAEYTVKKEVNVDVQVSAAVAAVQNVSVAVQPEEGHSFEIVAEQCRAAIAAYLASLPVGAPLYLAHLGRMLLDVEGVANYRLSGLSADVIPAAHQVICPGTITVTRLAAG